MNKAVLMLVGVSFLSAAPFMVSSATAADADNYVITIKDHRFNPETLAIPAGKKVRIQVKNEDPTAEEFESSDLNREKVVPPNGTVIVILGPLNPGTYSFYGEFHPKTAQGHIVVK